MSGLRNHAWALSMTLVAYVAFASAVGAAECSCCCTGSLLAPDCDHADGPGMTPGSDQGRHQRSGATKLSISDCCSHCLCQSCAVSGTDHTYAVNTSASGSINELAAAAWFSSVTPSLEIVTTNLSPPGISSYMPAFAGLQSVVLLI
jgi:hypothetical protein